MSVELAVISVILTAILGLIYKLYLELQKLRIKLTEIEVNVRWLIKIYKDPDNSNSDQYDTGGISNSD